MGELHLEIYAQVIVKCCFAFINHAGESLMLLVLPKPVSILVSAYPNCAIDPILTILFGHNPKRICRGSLSQL